MRLLLLLLVLVFEGWVFWYIKFSKNIDTLIAGHKIVCGEGVEKEYIAEQDIRKVFSNGEFVTKDGKKFNYWSCSPE